MSPEFSGRVDIRLGYRCNARCGFCYYLDAVDTPLEEEPTSDQIRRRLELMRREGATEVEFTGGEPTISPDVVGLVAHAHDLGYVNISFITNGLRLANPAFAEKLIAAGANDFLFSLHGHTAELHDSQTQVPGSFKKIMKAVENVGSRGARVRSSMTVNGENYTAVPDVVALLIAMDVACIHLAVFSPVAQADAANQRMFVSYKDATDYIKKAIDLHLDDLPLLSVKYVPFCFMKGYEKYVMNLYQQNFDPDDWNYYLSQKVRHGEIPFFSKAVGLAGLLGSLLLKDHAFPLRYGWYGLKAFGVTRLVELLRKTRPKACRSCRYDLVCDHVWKDYVKAFGDTEITSIEGKPIKDPAWDYQIAKSRRPGSRVGTVVPLPR